MADLATLIIAWWCWGWLVVHFYFARLWICTTPRTFCILRVLAPSVIVPAWIVVGDTRGNYLICCQLARVAGGLTPSLNAALFAGLSCLLTLIYRIRLTDSYTLGRGFDKLHAANFFFELLPSLVKLIISNERIANVDVHWAQQVGKPLFLCGPMLELLLKSFEMCNQITDWLIISLEKNLELHLHIHLPNVPRKKIFLKHKL